MKTFICCVPVQILWEKSCSWDCSCSLNQSDCRISKWTISPEKIDEAVSLLAYWSGQPGHLDSKIELTNGIQLLFACWYSFMKINLKVLEVGMIKNWCGKSCDGTLKLTVSEQWTDGINWFFACWYKFTKVKSWSIIFWVDTVKIECSQSGLRL